MLGLILFLVFGAIVGYLARLLLPGPDPMGCLGTTLLGAAGSVLGGVLVESVFGQGIDLSENGLLDYRAGWIGSVLGAILVLLVYRSATRR